MSGLFDWLLGDARSGGCFMSRLLEDEPVSAAPIAPPGPLLGDSVMGNAIRGALHGVAGDRRSPDFLSGFEAGLRSGVYAGDRRERHQPDQFREQGEQWRRDQAAMLPPPTGVDPEKWEAFKAVDPEGAIMFFMNSLRPAPGVQDSAGPAEAGPGVQPFAATASGTTPAGFTIAPIDGTDDCPAPASGMHSIAPDGIARAKPR
jgi:hypothetical protein